MILLDVYTESKQLKRIIVERSLKYKIPLRYICNDIGVNYRQFMNAYINGSSLPEGMNQYKFEKMLSLLGIDVRCQFVINGNYNGEAVNNELKRKYSTETMIDEL